MPKVILVINPGSVSTKCGIYNYEQKEMILEKEILHSKEELSPYKKITEQADFREKLIMDAFYNAEYKDKDLAAIAVRGGLLHPISGSVYEVNDDMVDDLKNCKYGEHASNLGAIIGQKLSKQFNVRVFIVDSVSVNELSNYAKISGYPKIKRIVRAHNLNIRRTARVASSKLKRELKETNLIGVHLGGGISIIAIEKGKFVDVNNALLGEGPWTTERAGTLPLEGIIDLCFDGKLTKGEIKYEFTKNSGLVAYLGSNDLREIERRVDSGDKTAAFYLNAMAYRVAKTIGGMAAVLFGKVDAIFLTGGMARCKQLVSEIEKRTSFIAPVLKFPGQYEMLALAEGVELALENKEEIHIYKKEL